jgi:hypothetical protein
MLKLITAATSLTLLHRHALIFAQSSNTEKAPAPTAIAATPMRAKFLTMVRKAQDHITTELEKIDGKKFKEDQWVREEGGGGWSRVCSAWGVVGRG